MCEGARSPLALLALDVELQMGPAATGHFLVIVHDVFNGLVRRHHFPAPVILYLAIKSAKGITKRLLLLGRIVLSHGPVRRGSKIEIFLQKWRGRTSMTHAVPHFSRM